MSKNVKLKSLLEGYAWERNSRDFGKPLPTLEDIQKAHEAKQDIKEDAENAINEAVTAQKAASLGFGIGPNSREKIDETSPEAVYIKDIADKLYNQGYPLNKLIKDKIVIAFIDGYVNSVSSSGYRNEGLSTMVMILSRVAVNGYPPKGQVLGRLK